MSEEEKKEQDIDLGAKTTGGWVTICEALDEESVPKLAKYFCNLFGEKWGRDFNKMYMEKCLKVINAKLGLKHALEDFKAFLDPAKACEEMQKSYRKQFAGSE